MLTGECVTVDQCICGISWCITIHSNTTVLKNIINKLQPGSIYIIRINETLFRGSRVGGNAPDDVVFKTQVFGAAQNVNHFTPRCSGRLHGQVFQYYIFRVVESNRVIGSR